MCTKRHVHVQHAQANLLMDIHVRTVTQWTHCAPGDEQGLALGEGHSSYQS